MGAIISKPDTSAPTIMALEQAWSILKNESPEWEPIGRSHGGSLADKLIFKPDKTPHSKEEILDLLIEHGGIMGRMHNAFGTPEWAEDMDGMENTGIFDSLDHHYGEQDPNASEEIAALQHGQWTQQDPPETDEMRKPKGDANPDFYDPKNPTPGQQSFIARAKQNLDEENAARGEGQ